MPEDIKKYSQLVSIVIVRLERIWEKGEGELTIRVTDDKGKRAKIEGGETDRI